MKKEEVMRIIFEKSLKWVCYLLLWAVRKDPQEDMVLGTTLWRLSMFSFSFLSTNISFNSYFLRVSNKSFSDNVLASQVFWGNIENIKAKAKEHFFGWGKNVDWKVRTATFFDTVLLLSYYFFLIFTN